MSGREGYTSGRDGTAGTWAIGSTITPAEFSWFARGAFYSFSELGGSYNLAAALIIGGQPVEITSATTFDGGSSGTHTTFTLGQYVNVSIAGSLVSTGTFGFTGSGSIGDSYTDGVNILACAVFFADVSFQGTSGRHSAISLDQYTSIAMNGGSFGTTGAYQLNGDGQLGTTASNLVTINARVLQESTRTFGTVGADKYRKHYAGDADFTMVNTALWDVLEFACTTGHTCLLPLFSTVPDGFRVRVFNTGTARLQIVDGGSNNYGYLRTDLTATTNSWVELQVDSNANGWTAIGGGKYAADFV